MIVEGEVVYQSSMDDTIIHGLQNEVRQPLYFKYGAVSLMNNDTFNFENGFDLEYCQNEEYKLHATNNISSGWWFYNLPEENIFKNQIRQFLMNDNFIIDLIKNYIYYQNKTN